MSKNGSGHISRDDIAPYLLSKIISQQQFQIKYMKGQTLFDITTHLQKVQNKQPDGKVDSCPV
jgi:hypothetical protein